MRIRTRILLFLAGVALLPLLVYGVVAIRAAVGAAEDAASLSARDLAEEAAGDLNRRIRGRLDALGYLAAGLPLDDGDRSASLEAVLRRTRQTDPTLIHLAVHDAQGLRLAAAPANGWSDAASRVARRVLETGGPVVTTAGAGEDAPHGILLGLAAVHDGRRVGAVTALFDGSLLRSLVSDSRLGLGDGALLLDEDGRPLAGVYDRRDGGAVAVAAAVVPDTGWTVVIELSEAQAFAAADRLALLLASLLLLALLVVSVVSWRGARALAAPLQELTAAIDRVSLGDFEARVSSTREDELGALARGFNGMADALGELSEHVRRQERLVAVGRIASGLAHDMKKPLQHLITHVRTVMDLPDNARARANLERALDREQRYIDGIFTDLAAFVSSGARAHSPIEVGALLVRVRDAVAPSAAQSGVAILVHEPDHELRLQADPVALERALRNVLENAVEAMRERGAGVVEVSVTESPPELRIVVEDDGPGIPEALLPRLFDPFRTSKQGIGMGLAVVRRIMLEHGGDVTASNGEVGARFVLRLPRRGPSSGLALGTS